MSYAGERQSLEDRFNTLWTDTEIAFDNVVFHPVAGVPWVRFSVLRTGADAASVGDTHYRYYGTIYVQIFTPHEEGARSADLLADSVTTIFRTKQFGGITCRTPQAETVGVQDGWLQTNVRVRFYRDEFI